MSEKVTRRSHRKRLRRRRRVGNLEIVWSSKVERTRRREKMKEELSWAQVDGKYDDLWLRGGLREDPVSWSVRYWVLCRGEHIECLGKF